MTDLPLDKQNIQSDSGQSDQSDPAGGSPFSSASDEEAYFYLVLAWIQSGNTIGATLAFLEKHLDLLQQETLAVLDALAPQLAGHPEMLEQLRAYKRVVLVAMRYGRTVESVRQAYRDVFGGQQSALAGTGSISDPFPSLVMTWLQAGPTLRHLRRFLEAHPDLLDMRTVDVLNALTPPPHVDPQAEEARLNLRDIVRDIVTDHGTTRDVPVAFINVFGGFMLDLPPWLEAEIRNITSIERQAPPSLTALERSRHWQDAWDRAMREGLAPEIIAEIAERIADSLTDISDERLPQAIEDAIAWYEQAQRAFTEDVYPRQWAHAQTNQGLLLSQRVQGSQAENQERAIACYEAASRVYTEDRLPAKWAMLQNNLAIVYAERTLGDPAENHTRAITHFQQALRVYSEAHSPEDWASTQINLANVYADYTIGDRAENQKRAIEYYNSALRIYSEDTTPEGWARAQFGLGNVYRQRKKGNRSDNQEIAITCYTAALRVFERKRFPQLWANTVNNLGAVYEKRFAGVKVDNQEQAIAYYNDALPMLSAMGNHRKTAMALANLYCDLGRWQTARDLYARIRQDTELLVSRAASLQEQDAIFKEESERVFGETLALVRVGQLREAVQCIEQGRARALAAARMQLAEDPSSIDDPQQRRRYLDARERLQHAQAVMYTPVTSTLSEEQRRSVWLQRSSALSAAQQQYNACLSEIRASNDSPSRAAGPVISSEPFHDALARCPQGHALVYLLATHWGGLALVATGATGARSPTDSALVYTALELPKLSWEFVESLLDTQLDVGFQDVVGGFAWGQTGNAFGRFAHRDWSGNSFNERAAVLHAACSSAGVQESFDTAAQAISAIPQFATVRDSPLDQLERLEPKRLAQLAGTFNHRVLVHEIRRGLKALAVAAMRPLAEALRAQSVQSVTIIPCGGLAAFPLLAAPVGPDQGEAAPRHWQTFADLFSGGASVAPSAQALVREQREPNERKGLRAIGNPTGSNPLHWGQAEALTLALLQGDITAARIQRHATRTNVLADLKEALVYEACCHGNGGTGDYLDYGLFLANSERLTLRDIFDGQVADLRGLRLFILSACLTGVLDLRGARDEVRSLAAGLVQAGAEAVISTQWAVSDRATYLLIVRFYQLWQESGFAVPPAVALAHAQQWLRTVTWSELRSWQAMDPLPSVIASADPPQPASTATPPDADKVVHVRDGVDYLSDSAYLDDQEYEALRTSRYSAFQAQEQMQEQATRRPGHERPYADPFFWAGFSVTGW